MRQNKYLNNIVEQDHRAIKRITRPMLGSKSFWSARILTAGIETTHMIRKGQMECPAGSTTSPAPQQTSSTALQADQMNANGLLRDTQFLMQQNRKLCRREIRIHQNVLLAKNLSIFF